MIKTTLLTILLLANISVFAGDIEVNNALVQGTLKLSPATNGTADDYLSYRIKITDDGAGQGTAFHDLGRWGGGWRFRTESSIGTMDRFELHADDNFSFFCIKHTNGANQILLSGSGDSFFTGHLGIGTTTPGTALDVNGTVQAKGLKVTTAPTNSYVMTSDNAGNGTWQAPSYFTVSYTNINAKTVASYSMLVVPTNRVFIASRLYIETVLRTGTLTAGMIGTLGSAVNPDNIVTGAASGTPNTGTFQFREPISNAAVLTNGETLTFRVNQAAAGSGAVLTINAHVTGFYR